MIGRRSDDGGVRDALASGKTNFSYRTLGTGEEVFIMDTALHFGKSEKILRVALRTYPSRKIIRQSRLQIWSAVGVTTVLLLVTAVLLISMKKREDLGKALAEKEKLSVLGEMAAGLAHEIRNPLGSIKGFAQYLRERCAGTGQSDDDAGYLDVIVSESGRIERLTEDLLSYSRKDTVRLEIFRPSDLLAELLSSMKPPASVSVKNLVDDSLVLTSDREKMRQIFANLIQNSLDAISGDGAIIVRGNKDGKMAVFSVEDNGTGVDEETISEIFRPFFTTKAKGTGLGLAIADRNVRLLGGRMSVASVAGKGSTFTFLLHKEMSGTVDGRT
jgi:two-component system sensor histidine kinase HydH